MQPAATPLTDAEIAELDTLLSSIHAPFEPMDAPALDGYLCGVLLQPVTIAIADWLPPVLDIEGRAVPEDTATRRIAALAQRRRDELAGAIQARRWFDPWIFEPDDPQAPATQAQLPWVAGFAAAMDRFPGLLQREDPALLEPLAVLYAPFDPQDLEDAQDLLPILETLEPPATMEEAAEDLVRSVLLLADVMHPQAPQRRGAAGRGRGRPARGTRR